MNKRPPPGKGKKSAQLLSNREQQYKELNAALEEKSTNLLSEVESVLRGQDTLFDDLTTTFNTATDLNSDDVSSSLAAQPVTKPVTVGTAKKNEVKQRPASGPSGKTKKKQTETKPVRAKSGIQKQHEPVGSEMDLIEERAFFANRINAIEQEAADEIYTPVQLDDNVLPDVASDMGSDATIRFLKAKLRVMQEELENMAADCREKVSRIGNLEEGVREKEENETAMVKKNEHLQNLIDKHKKTQEELRSKNGDLENELNSLKKEMESMKREKKQTSANKNTLELRLNRALEEVEKHKTALKSSRESSAVVSSSDRKRMDQLQTENKKLEKQRSELLTAFKKQMKLIDILKRQKMHVEAAKLLEFSEEEFVRALDWGKS